MKVKIINKSGYPTPCYAKDGDAGIDLTATEMFYDEYGNICYKTGLFMEIPKGFVGLIFPRSSISKYITQLTNCVGVIDSGYRGEIMFKFKPSFHYHNRDTELSTPDVYKVGDKIGQMIIMPYPQIEFEEVEDLSETDRGTGGFGSTTK